jgi:carbamoyl-phosphate synthase large subunit
MLKAKIVVCGAGGAPSEGVIHSLQQNPDFHVIGFGAEQADLFCSTAIEKHLIPYADDPLYREKLLKELSKIKPDLIHFQNDLEILTASSFRDEITSLGVKIFMPEHPVIEICTDKHLSYMRFKEAGLTVPENRLLHNSEDLALAFETLADSEGRVWIRDSSVGGGGKGSLSTSNFRLAREWIESNGGWGHYLAAEHLTNQTVTWQSIWHEGRLVAGQTRRRFGWIHGNRSASGVTGVTQIGETVSNISLTESAKAAVMAVDENPHGIYGVDFTLDSSGAANPTEINISRFFTTIRFFTEAGFNMPEIFARVALGESPPTYPILDPLPEGLLWIRGMDREPKLTNKIDFNRTFYL